MLFIIVIIIELDIQQLPTVHLIKTVCPLAEGFGHVDWVSQVLDHPCVGTQVARLIVSTVESVLYGFFYFFIFFL